ncbi:MAG: hypothetical protein SVQ76_01160 [Candidatus Nanohaloarchaea archaeon]|nr:hypothetical protein [Candidatus Nanohaloarchaea archaeon]
MTNLAGESDALPETLSGLMRPGEEEYSQPFHEIGELSGAVDVSEAGGRCPYHERKWAIDARNAEEAVVGYTVSHTVVTGRDWDGEEVPPLEALERLHEEGVDLYLPADTRETLTGHYGDGEEVRGIVDRLEAVTEPLRTGGYRQMYAGSARGEGMSDRSLGMAKAAEEKLGENSLLLTYNGGFQDFARPVNLVPVAPWQAYEGVDMNVGPRRNDEVNRIHSMIDEYVSPDKQESRTASMGDGLDEPLETKPDAVVVDESMSDEIVMKRSRWDGNHPRATWWQSLRFIDAAASDEEVELLMPDVIGERMEEVFRGVTGSALREDMEKVVETYHLPEDIDVPEGFRDESEDYRILRGAWRQLPRDYERFLEEGEGEPPVSTGAYDSDFLDMPGTTAVTGRAGTETLGELHDV